MLGTQQARLQGAGGCPLGLTGAARLDRRGWGGGAGVQSGPGEHWGHIVKGSRCQGRFWSVGP